MSGEEWATVEEGRKIILQWREERLKLQERQNSCCGFTLNLYPCKTMRSFMHNFNCVVFMHMVLAGVAVYIAKSYKISYDIQVGLLVSPIVFPLAFSIDADFKRRDSVLENIAHFESAVMILYFCMREWRKDSGLDSEWINAVHDKMKSLLFLLREYLFTDTDDNRKFILRAIYEDFSDTNQMIEQIRTGKLSTSAPLLSRVIHLLSWMCLSFERLRVVKEYRSPRSIRSFNKVLIMLLPIILAPYFVYVGITNKNEWAPYFISILMAFVFSTLQGVQDKLDDPFDGVGEDDIKFNTIDEWTINSLGATVQRYNIGCFNNKRTSKSYSRESIFQRRKSVRSKKGSIDFVHTFVRDESALHPHHPKNPFIHPYNFVLEELKLNKGMDDMDEQGNIKEKLSSFGDPYLPYSAFTLPLTTVFPLGVNKACDDIKNNSNIPQFTDVGSVIVDDKNSHLPASLSSVSISDIIDGDRSVLSTDTDRNPCTDTDRQPAGEYPSLLDNSLPRENSAEVSQFENSVAVPKGEANTRGADTTLQQLKENKEQSVSHHEETEITALHSERCHREVSEGALVIAMSINGEVYRLTKQRSGGMSIQEGKFFMEVAKTGVPTI